MTARVEVARSMLVGRRVAATDVAAGHAKTQVDPITADPKTIFTALGARCHRPDLIQV
jgi:tetrahydromethanopterin S-methyltransferase subunit D